MAEVKADAGAKLKATAAAGATVKPPGPTVEQLKAALRGAILDRSRVGYHDVTPGCSGVTWHPWVLSWAALCDLDLGQYQPHDYVD